nr:putative inactive leucine-rich repeat receptor kinase xiao [Quercus suber]
MKPTIANYLGLANTHLGCKEHERQALLKIKQDLIDDHSLLSSWSSDQDCCTWSRVGCSNQTGHVTKLDLSVSSCFSPRLLRVLEWLFNSNTSVVDLDLKFNEFQGSIPDDFTRINSLAHLYLDSNEFEGEIPKAFGGMCNLKTLSLSWNYLNGQLDFIQNLTECANHSLEVLRLDGNQIMGSLPDDLTTFLSLGELSLFRNHLNGTIPVSLGKLSNLEFLYLGDNPLKALIGVLLSN